MCNDVFMVFFLYSKKVWKFLQNPRPRSLLFNPFCIWAIDYFTIRLDGTKKSFIIVVAQNIKQSYELRDSIKSMYLKFEMMLYLVNQWHIHKYVN